MANKEVEALREEFLSEKFKDLENEAEYLIYGFDGLLPDVWIDSISIKRGFDGNFRAVLKGVRDRGEASATYVVSFSEGNSLGNCLGVVEFALAYGLIKWRIDKYANENNQLTEESDGAKPLSKVKVKKK